MPQPTLPHPLCSVLSVVVLCYIIHPVAVSLCVLFVLCAACYVQAASGVCAACVLHAKCTTACAVRVVCRCERRLLVAGVRGRV